MDPVPDPLTVACVLGDELAVSFDRVIEDVGDRLCIVLAEGDTVDVVGDRLIVPHTEGVVVLSAL